MEWYRSGHNEADSKSVSLRKQARGFEPTHSAKFFQRGDTWKQIKKANYKILFGCNCINFNINSNCNYNDKI